MPCRGSGKSPFVVRSGSGKFQAWYRHAGESRRIRPNPNEPIDILGGGRVIAPPSRGAKGTYQIIQGTLDDLDRLPPMRHAESPIHDARRARGGHIPKGQRNGTLHREACLQVRHARDVIEIGQALIRQKAKLGHGFYLKWIEAEFEMHEQTARRFVHVAERFGKSNTMLDLTPTALFELAAPSTPEEVVAEVERRVAAGELVTAAEAASCTTHIEPRTAPRVVNVTTREATSARWTRRDKFQQVGNRA